MRIAVTGASGFIGRHVLAELNKNQFEVIAVTRNAALLNGLNKSCQVVEMDIARPHPDCFEQLGCPDVLLHLAWNGLPNYKSLHHFEEELPVQYRFLNMLVGSGLNSIVVTGTCFEYGMQYGPLNENMETQPTNPYGFAKNALHRQLEYLRQNQPFALTWARLFYLYGEGQSENSLLPQLKRAVTRGDRVFNMSGGEQLRDYLSVLEVAKHLVFLATKRPDMGIVNVCSGKPVSVRTLVEGWIKENNWQIELNLGHYQYPDYEPMAFWGDRRKLDHCMEL
jgi:dTDP-6-deoxy-L-talose 4-dehydrogenase (NAD+)